MAKPVRVYCETLDIWFNTIKDAAKYAKVDAWSMSKKMDITGSFVDDEGNVYKRETPMKTRNIYNTTTNYTSIKRGKYSRKPNKKAETPDFVFADLPKVVQELINKTATDMILQERPWREVKSFLRSMGAKQLVLTLGDEDAE